MNTKEIFNASFESRLKSEGFLVEDIKQDISEDQQKKPSQVRVVRKWTGYSNEEVRQGLFNESRDILQPRIGRAILEILWPWIANQEDQGLPKIQAKELKRRTGLSSVEKVINTLASYPFTFSVNGSRFQSVTKAPEFPKDETGLTLNDCATYNISPKRVVKAARYQSRPPGGGPAQRIRLQEKRVNTAIKFFARQNSSIVFVPIQPEAYEEKIARKNETDPEIETIGEVMYFFENQRYNPQQLLKKWVTIVYPDEIVKRLTISNELVLFVPWGVRPEGKPRLEVVVMDRLQAIETNLLQKGVNACILIMPADVYATEVNTQVDQIQVNEYFAYIEKIATERGFLVKPWSEIRAENLVDYQTKVKDLTNEAIRALMGAKKIETAMGAAIRRSGYTTLGDVENSALAYLRERIIEAEIIESLYQPVKISVVAKVRDDIVDGDLPRIYLFPPELQFPWLK